MLKDRLNALQKLKNYILENGESLIDVKLRAERQNAWFTQANIDLALSNICHQYLDEEGLTLFSELFKPVTESNKLTIGIIMAGNIPLVGFHDFLCVLLSGHKLRIKFSSKDDVLLPHFIEKLKEWDESLKDEIVSSDMLKACDAYIATGSNNSSKYFEYYFAQYPHIIRKNRTSVAVLTGNESHEELEKLADDVYQYFGLGCRNVTKFYVPEQYDFIPLLHSFKKYDELKHHNKFRNNYEYNLAVYIINNQYYMSNESILLIENKSIFSSISVLHYEYYYNIDSLQKMLGMDQDIQVIIGVGHLPFGQAQIPGLNDFADGVNTVEFLNSLS